MLNNKWASDFLGVRQGYPLSPYLFTLGTQVLAKAFCENKNVTGIFVNKKEIKISEYADDTRLILDGSKNSLLASLKVIALYCIAHPYCVRFVASLARAHPGSNRFPMRLSSPEKRKVIYS